MIWLTWRQSRAQAVAALAALAAIAIGLAVTGPQLASLYAKSGLSTCTVGTCATLRSAFLRQVAVDPKYPGLFFVGLALLLLAPALIGVFWGAPLITRELEAGTLRLIWNQSVTRTRWLAVKLILIGSAAMATAALSSLMVTWWAGPIDRADGLPGEGEALPNRFNPLVFASRDLVPIGYTAFAVLVGVTVGLLIRRTLPAMAVTLVLVAAVQVVMPTLIRPHLIAPEHTTTALDTTGGHVEFIITGGNMTVSAPVYLPGAWIITNQTIAPDGRVFTGPPPPVCGASTGTEQQCIAAVDALHLRQQVTYQPADRFWTIQCYETGILLGLTFGLAALCLWRVRRLSIA